MIEKYAANGIYLKPSMHSQPWDPDLTRVFVESRCHLSSFHDILHENLRFCLALVISNSDDHIVTFYHLRVVLTGTYSTATPTTM